MVSSEIIQKLPLSGEVPSDREFDVGEEYRMAKRRSPRTSIESKWE
jgi:hypothetical protein